MHVTLFMSLCLRENFWETGIDDRFNDETM